MESVIDHRKDDNGEESCSVKWTGYPGSEATWEPLEHMNGNCEDIVGKGPFSICCLGTAGGISLPELSLCRRHAVHCRFLQRGYPRASATRRQGGDAEETSVADGRALQGGGVTLEVTRAGLTRLRHAKRPVTACELA